jgi:hypothetical protein
MYECTNVECHFPGKPGCKIIPECKMKLIITNSSIINYSLTKAEIL